MCGAQWSQVDERPDRYAFSTSGCESSRLLMIWIKMMSQWPPPTWEAGTVGRKHVRLMKNETEWLGLGKALTFARWKMVFCAYP